jgi:hypothetical protein
MLYCSDNCGIYQGGIKDLKLIGELNASFNEKIKMLIIY